MRRLLSLVLVVLTAIAPVLGPAPAFAQDSSTATPIRHLVVIFQENVSFDHYFATYPVAANPPGEPAFHASRNTPSVNGLSGGLLTMNPNLNSANGTGASNPFRLDRSQAATADQDHDYTAEQQAFDAGIMDLFPLNTGTAGPPPSATATNALVMGYYDGNTVTALWNYAQHFAMNDNSYDTNFGPSTPGALNLISGQTNGVINSTPSASFGLVPGGDGSTTLINDVDPIGDVCSASDQVQMGGQNIGDLLNNAGVTWGFFEGGFDLTITNSNGSTGCKRSTLSTVTAVTKKDYIPHHQPFQYYASTANPTHARPTSVQMVGKQDAANHQYDLHDFFDAVSAGNFPAVSFLKASGFQDGHAGYSDPLDEQTFIVQTINFLERQPDWRNTAVVILYDDSDGWYDHQMSPILNDSQGSADALTAPGMCGAATPALAGFQGTNHPAGRCGYGPRQPFLVISPFAKHNFVDHTVTDQSSVIRFVEDNWLGSQRIPGSFDAIANSITQMLEFKRHGDDGDNDRLFLNPTTGEVTPNHN